MGSLKITAKVFEERNVSALRHIDLIYKQGDTANVELIRSLNIVAYDALLLLFDEFDQTYDPTKNGAYSFDFASDQIRDRW